MLTYAKVLISPDGSKMARYFCNILKLKEQEVLMKGLIQKLTQLRLDRPKRMSGYVSQPRNSVKFIRMDEFRK